MKKVLLTVAILFVAVNLNAQTSGFGVKAGYAHITANVDVEGLSVSMSESGFFLGLVGEFSVSNSFSVQPELLFARVQEGNFVYVPIMAKFYVGSNFNLQAGPQLSFALADEEDVNEFGLDLAFGAGYDITQNFFVDARYGLEVTNRYTGAGSEDIKASYNTLMVGLGYKF